MENYCSHHIPSPSPSLSSSSVDGGAGDDDDEMEDPTEGMELEQVQDDSAYHNFTSQGREDLLTIG